MSDNDQLPPGLADFGQRLEELAEHDRRAALRHARPRPRLRALPSAVAAAVLAAAVAAGATAVIDHDGTPIKREPRGGDSIAPIDPSVVATTRVPDPAGGLPWILRIFTNAQGQECVVVGRLEHGRFGQVQNGRFRPLPASTPGLCGDTTKDGLLTFIDRRPDPARIAVYGITTSPKPLHISIAGSTLTARPAALGAFLVVVASNQRDPITITTTINGRRTIRRLG